MKVPSSTRKYTPEEKQQLIKNLDIEVEHRVRQLEEWLSVALENFRLHQEGLISRIPKLVRGVTMGEFADKYNGDIQACLRGLQSERMGGTEFEIDRDTRKRKWAAAQEGAEASGSGQGEQARAAKNARMIAATPKKPTAGTSNASRMLAANRTPGALRTTATRPTIPKPSPGPQKPNKPPPFVPVRTASPAKQPHNATTNQRTRPPSSATFNPTMLPPKAPTYPTLRAPRRDESMLSVNGSPLANPYALGLGWFTGEGVEEEESHLQGKGKGKQTDKTLRRVNSIVIRRDPSVSLTSSSSSSSPSQTQTQTNGTSRAHTRANSQIQRTAPPPAANSCSTQARSSSDAVPPSNSNDTPVPLSLATSSSASALVSIPTKDGHLLEFDPLVTSPRALDKLVGITDSAKKQAREEMARLVKEAVRKWVIE